MVKHIKGVEQLLVIYPYVVEGGFTVVSRTPATGLYDAHFGMVLTQDPPVCHAGYEGTDTPAARRTARTAHEHGRPLRRARVAVQRPRRPARPARRRVVRRAATAPAARRPRRRRSRPTTPATGRSCGERRRPPCLESRGSVAPRTLGEESWKWLFLQPLLTRGDDRPRAPPPTTGRRPGRRPAAQRSSRLADRAARGRGRARASWPAGPLAWLLPRRAVATATTSSPAARR